MKIELKLLPPIMPNFLPVEGWAERRIPIVELTYKQAEEYGETMKRAFIDHHLMMMKREAADKIKIALTF